MKRKILAGVLALMTVLSLAGCGGKANTENSSQQDNAASVAESAEEAENTPEGSSVQAEASSRVLEITIKSYRDEQVPSELKSVIMQTLDAAAGSYEDYNKVFDPDILIEAQLRSMVEDDEQLKELRAQYNEESRKMTVQKNYDMLHNDLAGLDLNSEFANLKIQTITGELDDSILFDLTFDIDSSDGMKSFNGMAYHIDGKWGAVFEMGEHKPEEGSQQQDKESAE